MERKRIEKVEGILRTKSHGYRMRKKYAEELQAVSRRLNKTDTPVRYLTYEDALYKGKDPRMDTASVDAQVYAGIGTSPRSSRRAAQCALSPAYQPIPRLSSAHRRKLCTIRRVCFARGDVPPDAVKLKDFDIIKRKNLKKLFKRRKPSTRKYRVIQNVQPESAEKVIHQGIPPRWRLARRISF